MRRTGEPTIAGVPMKWSIPSRAPPRSRCVAGSPDRTSERSREVSSGCAEYARPVFRPRKGQGTLRRATLLLDEPAVAEDREVRTAALDPDRGRGVVLELHGPVVGLAG